jgi:DeoR family ulaG and ulaABCDEF operon transcriptional repressor
MHAAEREELILLALKPTGFVSYRDLELQLDASPATIRRDLARLEAEEKLRRVHGGARMVERDDGGRGEGPLRLTGTPFDKSLGENLAAKRMIGKAAAALCVPGEGIMIDGGTTTYQMCEYLDGLRLQVLTNSLHIVNALLPQEGTRVLVPSGTIFREQNIILAPEGEASMPRFHGPKLFMGAAAVGPQGVMQADTVLVASQRRLIERAEQVIVLVDSSKFVKTSGAIVCGLDEIDLIVTDAGISPETRKAVERAHCEVRVVV